MACTKYVALPLFVISGRSDACAQSVAFFFLRELTSQRDFAETNTLVEHHQLILLSITIIENVRENHSPPDIDRGYRFANITGGVVERGRCKSNPQQSCARILKTTIIHN